jgi:hypothetical protein
MRPRGLLHIQRYHEAVNSHHEFIWSLDGAGQSTATNQVILFAF